MPTVANLITEIRTATDQSNSTFLTDAELTTWINAAYKEGWDLFVEAAEDYGINSVTFTISSGNTYAIVATDFYKIRGLDYSLGSGNYDTVMPVAWSERNRNGSRSYKLMGSTLYILPTDLATGTYTLWYVTKPADLTSGDSIVDYNGVVQKYIVEDVSARIRAKAEEDPSPHVQAKAAIIDRLRRLAAGRDQGAPRSVIDIRGVAGTPDVWWW